MWVTNSIRKYLEADKLEQFSKKKTKQATSAVLSTAGNINTAFQKFDLLYDNWERREGKRIQNFHQFFYSNIC